MATGKTALSDDLDETPDTPNTPPPGMVPLSAIEGLGKSIADAINSTQRRKQPFGAYDPKSSYHPNKAKIPKLHRDFYQNGYRANPITLMDEEIHLLNRITHSGRYLNRVVEVRVDDSSAEEVVHINYNNKGIEQRLQNKQLWNGLVACCGKSSRSKSRKTSKMPSCESGGRPSGDSYAYGLG